MHEAQRQAKEELTRLQLESCRAEKSALKAQLDQLSIELAGLNEIHEANCRQSAVLFEEVTIQRDRISKLQSALLAWNVLGDYLQQFLDGTFRLEPARIEDIGSMLCQARNTTKELE